MDFKKLFSRAKNSAEDVIEKRGGTDALKEDAAELKDIATHQGSLSDKAKEAAEALKTPGDGRDDAPKPDPAAQAGAPAEAPVPDPEAPVPPAA
jgi:hypothetical protein